MSNLPDDNTTNPLEHFREYAVTHGADDVVIIPVSDVILDPRVRFKCMIPRCHTSGMCSHCPPYGHSNAEMKEILSQYRSGIFFRVTGKGDIIANPLIAQSILNNVLDDEGVSINIGPYYFLVFSIVKLLEREARTFGYRTAGFAAGDCRDILCSLQFMCQRTLLNRSCRVPELSCPSMESCGMNVYTMAARSGWDIYPIKGNEETKDVPKGSLMGLVLVGESQSAGSIARTVTTGEKKLQSKKIKKSLLRRLHQWIRKEKNRLIAMKQYNISIKQLPLTIRERRMWMKVLRNFRALSGSWTGSLRLMLKVFEGRPREQ